MGSTAPALRLRGVMKTFGTTRAVDGLDLVPRGATYGVIGTLIRWARAA